MDIFIHEPKDDENEKIDLYVRNLTPEILAWIAQAKNFQQTIIGYDDDKIHQIPPQDIFYFESVDNTVFAYCQSQVFKCREKLYELEEALQNTQFLRISKSIILNLQKIEYLTPAYNGRFEATLKNQEKVIISRQYTPMLKEKLKM